MRIFEDHVLSIYNKTLSTQAWSPPGVSLIAARKIWPSTRGENAVVAILDTGVDYHHPDLKANIIGGMSFVETEKDFIDLNGHGTHVAGTIAAHGRILGVAPQSKILAIKVLGKNGAGSYRGICQGLEYARHWKGPRGEVVNVVNMSLGGPIGDPAMHREIKKAIQTGISVVCAAGNAGDGMEDTREITYPAYFPEAIAVGAVDLQTGIANFSNSNDHIDIVAPGVETYSTYPGGKYVKLSGTSMATPHISGAVALIYSRYHKRFGVYPDVRTVNLLLHYGSIDMGEAGFDELYGFGMFSFNPDGGKNLCLYCGSNQYLINGRTNALKAPLINSAGEIYAPLPEIANLLGSDTNPIVADPAHPENGLEIWV